jgi:hypothetical protein
LAQRGRLPTGVVQIPDQVDSDHDFGRYPVIPEPLRGYSASIATVVASLVSVPFETMSESL